jgi:hypothetical protein
MLIPLRARRYRARESKHLAPQFDKFLDGVQSLESRFSVGKGHDTPPRFGGSTTELSVAANRRGLGGDRYTLLQASLYSVVTIAHSPK